MPWVPCPVLKFGKGIFQSSEHFLSFRTSLDWRQWRPLQHCSPTKSVQPLSRQNLWEMQVVLHSSIDWMLCNFGTESRTPQTSYFHGLSIHFGLAERVLREWGVDLLSQSDSVVEWCNLTSPVVTPYCQFIFRLCTFCLWTVIATLTSSFDNTAPMEMRTRPLHSWLIFSGRRETSWLCDFAPLYWLDASMLWAGRTSFSVFALEESWTSLIFHLHTARVGEGVWGAFPGSRVWFFFCLIRKWTFRFCLTSHNAVSIGRHGLL